MIRRYVTKYGTNIEESYYKLFIHIFHVGEGCGKMHREGGGYVPEPEIIKQKSKF